MDLVLKSQKIKQSMKETMLIIKKMDKESLLIKLIMPNGNIFEGVFIRDKPNGYGRLILTDGSVKEGIWVEGKFQQ